MAAPSTALPNAALIAPRHQPHEGPLRVLIGKEQFSENHAWSEMPQHWRRPALPAVVVIEVVGQGQLEARLAAQSSLGRRALQAADPERAERAGRAGVEERASR